MRVINVLIIIIAKRNALATFTRYGKATKWPNYWIYIVTQKFKMAAANAIYFLINWKKQ